MVKVILSRQKQYYKDKYGEKIYLIGDPEKDQTLVEAAMLTGKGLGSEKEIVHTAYGNTLAEAKSSMTAFLNENPEYSTLETEEVE